MKRIATAAVAATLSFTAVATPAIAQETEKVGSSEAYKECKLEADELFAEYEEQKKEATTDAEKAALERAKAEELENWNSSTPSGACIKAMTDSEYRSSMLGLLIGVPVALVAILGVAAAYAGVIPGVELPALPF